MSEYNTDYVRFRCPKKEDFVVHHNSLHRYGVCKECKLISVKVFDDEKPYPGSSASILIAGFDWIAKHFKKDRKNVINVSVGGNPGEYC